MKVIVESLDHENKLITSFYDNVKSISYGGAFFSINSKFPFIYRIPITRIVSVEQRLMEDIINAK